MMGMFEGLEKGERTTERVREQLRIVNEETQLRLQEKTQTKDRDNKK